MRKRHDPWEVWLLVGALCASACGDTERKKHKYPLVFNGRTDTGEPLPGITLRLGKTDIGKTGADGKLAGSMPGKEGEERIFGIECPEGYSAEEPSVRLRLRGAGPNLAPPEAQVDVECQPDERLAALIVRAPEGFGGLPVKLHGREIGRTDEHGVAHVVLRAEERTPLRVVLDTSSMPRVTPANPHQDLQMKSRDEIVVFAPELVKHEPKRVKRRRKAKKKPQVLRPERLR